MREKEPAKAKKKFSLGRKWKLFIILIILIIVGILLFRWLSVPEKETFSLEKKDDNTISIYGLTEEQIDEVDWQRGAAYAEYYKGSEKQYRLQAKKGNFFQQLIRKPKTYETVTDLKDYQVRGKKIEFEGVEGKTNITIPKTKLEIKVDVFSEKSSWGVERVFWILFYGISFLISLYFFDMIFGSNFIGFIASIFRPLKGKPEAINISKIRFKDVGGLQEAKEELGEVVSYFRSPQTFWQRGATVPRGILLSGPPGNGKTLLAKALAGECGLPFLFRSGSEFEEMMVGVGARRMRDLFNQARSLPQGCIIFIDEIDSIGRKRYSRNGGYSHSEMTLNQLLNELDGFRPRDNIIILAATNSLNVLDAALLRPGRFDRQIYIPIPSFKGRREIIALHARKLPLKPELDLEEIASMTRGFSGAQIVNMFNEASILSIRYNKKLIDYETIFEAYDRTLMGPSLTSYTITPEKKKIIAYHEAGHAVVGMSLPETIVRKITIIPRLHSGGYTWIELYGEQGDDYMLKKNQMLADVMSFLGGRASEELIFGLEHITMGAASDFKQASAIIQDLILRYGMSDLGIIHTQESFLYEEEIPFGLPESTKQKIENEREKILNKCWKKVRKILRQKKQVLKLLAEILLEKNSLHKDEINYIFINQTSPHIPLLN